MDKVSRRALILGGQSGLLGQALMLVLRKAGWDIHSAGGRSDFENADLPGKSADLERLIDKVNPDCIFNTIAYTQVDLAEDHEREAMEINAVFPTMLGRAVKNLSTPERSIRLVHYSTDFVFSGDKETPYTTDDRPNPQSVYGKSKLAGEEALLRLDLPECCIIRTAWMFGPGKKNFVSAILNICGQNGGVDVVHDQVGSPTYTLDLAAYTVKLLEYAPRGVFHIVNGGQASWCEFASEAVHYAQLECPVTPIPSEAYPQKAKRPAYSVLDTSRFTKVTGITPRPWPQALREYILLGEGFVAGA